MIISKIYLKLGVTVGLVFINIFPIKCLQIYALVFMILLISEAILWHWLEV